MVQKRPTGRFKSFEKLLGRIGINEGVKSGYDDNPIDRLSHYYTVIFLLLFNVISVAEEWFQFPVKCFCPPEFTLREVKYTNNVCWISNMYYVPWGKPIPKEPELRKAEAEIFYYHWVPLSFFFMAFWFHFPRMVWKQSVFFSSINIKHLLELANNSQACDQDQRDKNLKDIANFITQYCKSFQPHRAGIATKIREKCGTCWRFGIGKHVGNYFIPIRVFIRFLYVVNSFCQLYFLNAFIGNEFSVYSYEVFRSFLNGERYMGTPRFPVVTMCDIEIRRMFTYYRYTLQCAIPVNAYYHKFFLFLWFWVTLVAILSSLNLMYTLLTFMMSDFRVSFIKKYLKMNDIYKSDWASKSEREDVAAFIRHLSHDGVFIIKILAANTNTVITSDMVKHLWKIFMEGHKRNGKRYPKGILLNGTARSSSVSTSNGSLGYHSKADLLRHFPKETFV